MQSSADRFKNVKKIGSHNHWLQDIYHSLLVFSWWKFFLVYLFFFFVFNIGFGLLYWVNSDALAGTDHSFLHAFAFSVQTFSTVGYGAFHPQTSYAHIIVVIQSILSVFVTAVLTGLIFAKFSRPSARIIFSNNILINQFDGKRTLMLRMGNLRANQIAEAQVRMIVLKSFETSEGQTIRRQMDLNLVRSSSLFFALTWSVMHIIDEKSPFFGLTAADLKEQNIDIGVSIIGYDSTFSQSIHSSCIYSHEDVIFDAYFEDVFNVQDGKVMTLNYHKFNEIKKVPR